MFSQVLAGLLWILRVVLNDLQNAAGIRYRKTIGGFSSVPEQISSSIPLPNLTSTFSFSPYGTPSESTEWSPFDSPPATTSHHLHISLGVILIMALLIIISLSCCCIRGVGTRFRRGRAGHPVKCNMLPARVDPTMSMIPSFALLDGPSMPTFSDLIVFLNAMDPNVTAASLTADTGTQAGNPAASLETQTDNFTVSQGTQASIGCLECAPRYQQDAEAFAKQVKRLERQNDSLHSQNRQVRYDMRQLKEEHADLKERERKASFRANRRERIYEDAEKRLQTEQTAQSKGQGEELRAARERLASMEKERAEWETRAVSEMKSQKDRLQAELTAIKGNLEKECRLRAEDEKSHTASLSKCLSQMRALKQEADVSRSSVERERESALERVEELEKLLKNVQGDAKCHLSTISTLVSMVEHHQSLLEDTIHDYEMELRTTPEIEAQLRGTPDVLLDSTAAAVPQTCFACGGPEEDGMCITASCFRSLPSEQPAPDTQGIPICSGCGSVEEYGVCMAENCPKYLPQQAPTTQAPEICPGCGAVQDPVFGVCGTQDCPAYPPEEPAPVTQGQPTCSGCGSELGSIFKTCMHPHCPKYLQAQ